MRGRFRLGWRNELSRVCVGAAAAARTRLPACSTMRITPTNGRRHSGQRRDGSGAPAPAPPACRHRAPAQAAQRPPWPHSTRTASGGRSMHM